MAWQSRKYRAHSPIHGRTEEGRVDERIVALNAIAILVQVDPAHGGPQDHQEAEGLWQAMYSLRADLMRDNVVHSRHMESFKISLFGEDYTFTVVPF